MYKDKDKQREANKEASQRRRDKQKGMTNQGVTVSGSGTCVTPKCTLYLFNTEDKVREFSKTRFHPQCETTRSYCGQE